MIMQDNKRFYWVFLITAVPDDIDASVLEGVKDSN